MLLPKHRKKANTFLADRPGFAVAPQIFEVGHSERGTGMGEMLKKVRAAVLLAWWCARMAIAAVGRAMRIKKK